MSRHAHPDDLTAERPAVTAGPATGPIDLARVPSPRTGEPELGPDAPGVPVAYTRMAAHDGGSGNPLRRAEPKVKAASVAALLTPIALFYGHQYIPGVDAMPTPVLLAVDSILTGLAAFLAGFVARAVDRLDLWVIPDEDPPA